MSRRYPFQYQFVVTARQWLAWVAAVIVLCLAVLGVMYVAGDGYWPPRTTHGVFTVRSCRENNPWYEQDVWLCSGSFRTSAGGVLTPAVTLSSVRGQHRPGEGARIEAWVRGPQAYVATPRITGRLVLIWDWVKVLAGQAVLLCLAIGVIHLVRRKWRTRRRPGEQWPGWE